MITTQDDAQSANTGCGCLLYPILAIVAWFYSDGPNVKWVLFGISYLWSCFAALNEISHKRPADRTLLEIQSPIVASVIPLYHGMIQTIINVALLCWALQ